MNDYDADSAPENGPPAPGSTAGPRAVASTGRPLADPAAGRETGAGCAFPPLMAVAWQSDEPFTVAGAAAA